MKREEVINQIKEHLGSIKNYKVKSLSIFGSVARNEANSESDIDILVEFTELTTLDMYMDLKFYLEDFLGKKVDLVELKTLKPQLKKHIEKEIIILA